MSSDPIQNLIVSYGWSPIRIFNVNSGHSFYSTTNSGAMGPWSTPTWPDFNSSINKYDIQIVSNPNDPATPPTGSGYPPVNYGDNVYIRTGPWFHGHYNHYNYFATANSGTTFTNVVDATSTDPVIWQIANKDDITKTGPVLYEDTILLEFTDPTNGNKYYMDFEEKDNGYEIDMNDGINVGSAFQFLMFRPV